MSNLETGLEQTKQLLRNAVGKETLSAVGSARGSAASRKYADVFASKLAIEFELKMSNPMVVLTNFETEITIEGDTFNENKTSLKINFKDFLEYEYLLRWLLVQLAIQA